MTPITQNSSKKQTLITPDRDCAEVSADMGTEIQNLARAIDRMLNRWQADAELREQKRRERQIRRDKKKEGWSAEKTDEQTDR